MSSRLNTQNTTIRSAGKLLHLFFVFFFFVFFLGGDLTKTFTVLWECNKYFWNGGSGDGFSIDPDVGV